MKNVDIAVYNPDGKLQLVVEVKNKPRASAEWVAHLRRNLLAHAFIPPSPYFLLALPDFFYLWKDAVSLDIRATPDFRVSAPKVMAPYLNRFSPPLSLNDLSHAGFELLMTAWLENIIRTELQRDAVDPNLHWLFDSGLYEAIARGSVAIEAMAMV